MENLRNQVTSIETQHSELEAMYAQLSKNYDRSTQTLNDVNKERRQLYEDASRNERLLNEQELEIKELKKCYNLERVNYDKIKSRFSQVEIEYENLEIIKKKEVRKFEIEKETVEQQLELTQQTLNRCDDQRKQWIKRYEEEYDKTLATLSQLNNLRMDYEDLRALKNKLESDIREMDKMNKVKIKQAKEQEERTDAIIRENEKLRIELEGAK